MRVCWVSVRIGIQKYLLDPSPNSFVNIFKVELNKKIVNDSALKVNYPSVYVYKLCSEFT